MPTDSRLTPRTGRSALDPKWRLLGFLLLLVAWGMLEYRQPYYFCQDDVMVTDFPLLLWSCRSVWRGEIPEYGPFNCLGGPWLSQGRGATYPPLYAAYGLARHILRDEHATMELYALLHFLCGYAAVFRLLRRWRVRGSIAMLAGLTFVFSGPVLALARSWFQFSAVAALVPWLALTADQLRDRPVRWWWTLQTAGLLALLYHAGFPQLWLFGCGFFGVQVLGLVLSRAVSWPALCWLAPALLLAASLIYPLFSQQWELARGLPVEPPLADNALADVLSLWLPYPLHIGSAPYGWGSLHDGPSRGHFLYFGSIMPCFALAAVWDLLCRWCRLTARRRGTHVWTICGLLAAWFCLSDDGGLWTWVVSGLPTGMRNHPLRILPWFVLFTILAGALSIERWLRQFQRRAMVSGLLVTVGCGLLFYHVHWARNSFYTFGCPPYPAMPAALDETLDNCRGPAATERILSLFPPLSPELWYPYGLSKSLSSAYEMCVAGGSDPILERQRVYREAMRSIRAHPERALPAYGVRWLLKPSEPLAGTAPGISRQLEVATAVPAISANLQLERHATIPVTHGSVIVERLSRIDPLCFSLDEPGIALPIRIHGDGIAVSLPSHPTDQRLLVNFLHYPRMQAEVDGQSVTLQADEWGRMVVAVPAESRHLRLTYRPNWRRGFQGGAAVFGIGVATLLGIMWGARTAWTLRRGPCLPTWGSPATRLTTLNRQLLQPLTMVALITAGVLGLQAQLPRLFISSDGFRFRLAGRLMTLPTWMVFLGLIGIWCGTWLWLSRTSFGRTTSSRSLFLALYRRFAVTSIAAKSTFLIVSLALLILVAMSFGVWDIEGLRLQSYRWWIRPVSLAATLTAATYFALIFEPIYLGTQRLTELAGSWRLSIDRLRWCFIATVSAAWCLSTASQHQFSMSLAAAGLTVCILMTSFSLNRLAQHRRGLRLV